MNVALIIGCTAADGLESHFDKLKIGYFIVFDDRLHSSLSSRIRTHTTCMAYFRGDREIPLHLCCNIFRNDLLMIVMFHSS